MNCPHCGAENAPETNFCIGCGAPMAVTRPVTPAAPAAPEVPVAPEAPVVPETPAAPAQNGINVQDIKQQLSSTLAPVSSKAKSLFSKKAVRFGVIGGIALLVVLLVVSAIFGNSNGYIKVDQEINYYCTDKDEYSIVVGNKVLKQTIKSEKGIDSFSNSLNGKSAALLTGENELYVVSGNKMKQIAEDVVSFALSVNGKGIAYSTRGKEDKTTTLYLAKVSNGKATKITNELGRGFVIAPDGNSVAYFEDGGDEDPDELMYFKGKKSTSICDDKNARLYGMSNNGKQIYVSITKESEEENETILYSFNNKGKKTKLETIGGSVRFNDDHSQIMFLNKENKTYISTNGKAAKKVRSEELSLIIAPGSASMGSTYPVSNLYGHVYANNDNDVYMIKKNKDIKLISKATNVQLDGSAEYLYYMYDREEVRMTKISYGEKASEKAKTIIDDGVGFIVTYDRKYVYFSEDSKTLMAVNGKKGGVAREITDEMDGDVALSANGKLFYTMDGDLYVVTNGKKGKKVLSDVDSLHVSDNGYVYAQGDDKIYVSTGSNKPKQILEIEK